MINHYCFAGKKSFQNNFKARVVGGGTGDATIFLAEQLKASSAEVLYLNVSQASMVLARRRAKIRGLSNFIWLTRMQACKRCVLCSEMALRFLARPA